MKQVDVLRSPLFVPGNNPKMLEKALTLNPDAYIPDMEDSVPFAEKENARRIVQSFLNRLYHTGRPVIPRLNSISSGLLEDDLRAVVGPLIQGVSIGKIDSRRELTIIEKTLNDIEGDSGLEIGTTRLIPWIETASGVMNAFDICSASSRVMAVAFGADDLTSDMGIQRAGHNTILAHARSTVCIAAHAAGVMALDTPFVAFKDQDGLNLEAVCARRFGFQGKFAIHPSQIDTINKAFYPSEDEIEEATRIVNVYEEARGIGSGSTSLDGKLVDAPVFKRALNLLKLADRSGGLGSTKS